MSVLPAIEYYYVFRLDNYEIGPQAWTIWAAAIVMGLLVRLHDILLSLF